MIISADAVREVFTAALNPGDDVLIHASLGNLGHFEAGVDDVIVALQEAVGPTGTVIMMTDTRSFAKSGEFFMDQPSETGLLTEHFRLFPGVKRSCVPMVSFCAIGERSDFYTEVYHSHLDAEATITRLLERDGKIMLIGIGYEKCTLYHLAEERHKTPYNFYKSFEGELMEEGKAIRPISQRYFVRRDMNVKKNPAIGGIMLEERDQSHIAVLGDDVVRTFRARDFDACCMDALARDPDAFLEKSKPSADG